MNDHRTRRDRPQAKSLARLAAEAAFAAPAAPAAPASTKPPPARHDTEVPVIHRRARDPAGGAVGTAATHGLPPDAGSAAAAGPQGAALASALVPARPPRVFRLGDATAPLAAQAEAGVAPADGGQAPVGGVAPAAVASPRRRQRSVAPPVTVIYRAPEAPAAAGPGSEGPGQGASAADLRAGSAQDLARLQAGIEAEMALASQAAAFDLSGSVLSTEWERLSAEVEQLAGDLVRVAQVPVESIV